MQLSRKKQFFITFAVFLVLGASFKVMVLVDGLTEVRPVNAIPPVAGLLFGPVGALACSMGNLFADFFGTFGWSSILGVIANFIAAFLPYRLWHLFREEAPNMHTNKNLLFYIWISLVNALTTAWILSFGLYTFFGAWVLEIYTYVFFNNLGFSIGLGLPLLIVLTSQSVSVECWNGLPNKLVKTHKTAVSALYFAFMLAIFVCVVFAGLSPINAPWLNALSVLSLLGLTWQII